MELVFKVSAERQQVWVERLQRLIQEHVLLLETESKGFAEIEREYLEWKGRIDKLKSTISADQYDLDTFVQAEKLKEKKVADDTTQRQVAKIKKGYDANGFKNLPIIKWESVIPPALAKIGKFVFYKTLWNYLVENKMIDDNMTNHKRFYVACSSRINSWTGHEGAKGIKKIGLKAWMDNGACKPEYLKDFIGTNS